MKARVIRRRRLALQGKWSRAGGVRVHTTRAAAIAAGGFLRITRDMLIPPYSPERWANTPGDE